MTKEGFGHFPPPLVRYHMIPSLKFTSHLLFIEHVFHLIFQRPILAIFKLPAAPGSVLLSDQDTQLSNYDHYSNSKFWV